MGSKHLIHLPYIGQSSHGKKQAVPKGCLAVKVGQGDDQQRFVVPVTYFNHPLFMQLLKEAEKEFGFAQKGKASHDVKKNVTQRRKPQAINNYAAKYSYDSVPTKNNEDDRRRLEEATFNICSSLSVRKFAAQTAGEY
ncbi:auxin-responsive protein SAUR32 [Tanacetum coccineum]